MEAIKHTKICTKCKLEKDLLMFGKKSSAKDGLSSNCKSCEKETYKKYYALNKEKIKNKVKEYASSNKEKILSYSKNYYLENKEKFSASSAEYRNINKEKIALYKKEWQDENKDRLFEYREEWRNSTQGKICKANAGHKRRVLKQKNNNGTLPKNISFPYTIDLIWMYENQKYLCNYCGCNIEKENMHLDHIEPLAKGGMHSIDNVQWLCQTCNLQKGSKLEHDFLMGKSFSISLS